MHALTLDYRLEGQRRGYTLRDPQTDDTPDLPADDLRVLWKSALPRGQGWGDPQYLGAQALKCFPLPSGLVVFSRSVVTEARDEAGRAGIRRADIALMNVYEAEAALVAALAALPPATVAEAERRLSSREWGLLFRKVRDTDTPRSFVKPQTILAYESPATGAPFALGWQFMEACLLLLVTRQTLLANLIEVTPRLNPFADRIVSMTTLALDYRDESRLVGMPMAAAQAADIPTVDLRG